MQPTSLNQAAQAQRLFFLQQQQQQLQLQLPFGPAPTPPTPEAGTLFIRDTFTPTPDGSTPHGIQVDYAQSREGFQGPVVTHQQTYNEYGQQVSNTAASNLGSVRMNQQQALDQINNFTIGSVDGMLQSQAHYLDGLTERGTHNSAVNLSWGTSKARLTERLYENGSPWTAENRDQYNQRLMTLDNYATAFELDTAKLMNPDPEIHGPERQKLQQGLLNQVSQTVDNSPHIANARQIWDDSVARFEGQNNSVVIAAGNEGDHENRLEQKNHGLPLEIPENFSTNVLENDQVTSVGATRWFENNGELSEYRARYSSDSSGIDIYASGSIGLQDPERADSWGTSFAAPKVAATMAELHRLYPNLSSAQIEDLMKSNLTHDLNTGSAGTIQVLDYQKNFEFLNNQTF